MKETKKLKESWLICLVVLLTLSPCHVVAQNLATWKDTPVTLRKSNITLGAMLELVAKTAGAKIELRGISLMGIDKDTTLNVTHKPLDKVIGELIGNQNVKVEYDDTQRIIISSYDRLDQVARETADTCFVEGFLRDEHSGEALIGVTILITNGTQHVDATRGSVTY